MSRTRTIPRLIALVAMASLPVAALAGCSSSDDVASLGKGSAKPSSNAQTVSAEKFASCLKEADIPAKLDDKGTRVDFDTEDAVMFDWGNTNGQGGGGGSMSSVSMSDDEMNALQKKWDAMMADHEDGDPFLAIGDQDYSEDFGKCLTSSKYVEPEYEADPKEEMQQKEATVAAGAKWASCAREHNFPGIKDPAAPVADGWKTQGDVRIPWSITEDQLKELVAACPIVDLDELKKQYQEYKKAEAEGKDLDDSQMGDDMPNVTIEVPGMDKDGAYGELKKADQAKLDKLNAILYEQMEAFGEWMQEQDGDNGEMAD